MLNTFFLQKKKRKKRFEHIIYIALLPMFVNVVIASLSSKFVNTYEMIANLKTMIHANYKPT